VPTYSRYKPGEQPEQLTRAAAPSTMKPGDVGFVYDHKPSLVHEAIWARQRAEAGKDSEWANLTHMFCCLDDKGTIIEALSEGQMVNDISKYKGMDYWIVHVDANDEQRALSVARWEKQKGLKYSKITFVSETLLCWGIPLRLGWGNQFICSALAGFGMLTWVVSFPQPFEEQTPFDVARFLELPINSPIRPLSFIGRFMNRIVFVGRIFTSPFR
jgi:hypothetical protein